MTALHPTADELALYVTDMLDGRGAAQIEDHVLACGQCADALAAEARLDLALEQVAEFRARKAVTPLRTVKSVLAAALVAAAAVLIVFAGEAFTGPPAPEDPAPAVVISPSADAGTALANNDSGAEQ